MDFGYVVAAAYMGFIVWTSGASCSIALANTDPTSTLNIIYKLTQQTVSLRQTLLTLYNILPTLAILISFPFLLKIIAPHDIKTIHRAVLIKEAASESIDVTRQPRSFATIIENAWILNLIIIVEGVYEFFGSLQA